jgi:hypothetical protein
VLQRLGALDSNTVVFTPGYFQDGDGRLFNPRDSAALMAAAATAPLYGKMNPSRPFEPFTSRSKP